MCVAGQAPISSAATWCHWWPLPPMSTWFCLARVNRKCASSAQVKPTPPCTWMLSPVKPDRSVGGVCGRHGGGPGPLRRTGVRCPRGEMHAGSCHLEGVEHIDDPVLDDLEGGDGTVEDHPALRVLDRLRHRPVADADELGREGDRHVVEDRPPEFGLITGRTERFDRLLLEHQAGELAGRVQSGDGLGLRGAQQERADPVLGQGHDDHPFGALAVDDRRLGSADHPSGPPAAGAGTHGVQGMAVPLLLDGHGAPRGTGCQLGDQVTGTEGPCREHGQHRGGEEGTGQGHPPHLLEDDAGLEQPGTRARFEQGGPPECDQPLPVLRREPDRVVSQDPDRVATDLVHGPPRHILERQLFRVECEVHLVPPEARSPKLRQCRPGSVSLTARGLRTGTRGRGLPGRTALLARRAPPTVPHRGRAGRRHRHVTREAAAPPGQLAARPQRGTVGSGALARGVRGQGGHRHAADHLLRGHGRVPHPRHRQSERPLADRADDHRLGHRGAARPLAALDPRCLGPLVPGVLRAGCGQRPGQPAHDRPARRRQLRGQRAEDLDLDRPPRTLGPVPAPHGPHGHRAGGQARGHHRLHRRHAHPRHRGATHPGHDRRGDVQRGVLPRRPPPPRQPARR